MSTPQALQGSPLQRFWLRQLAKVGDCCIGFRTDQSSNPPRAVPVMMQRDQRARGLYIIGHPGQGKTTLVQNLILKDLAAGNGLILLTSEEETFTERLLPFIPRRRWDDVVYINPRDVERPVAFNPLHVNADEDFEQKRSQTITILRRLFAERSTTPAPRAEMILGHAVSTLMQIPGSTLEDIPKLIDPYDPAFRRRAVERIRDERDREFWTSASMYARFPKDSHLPLLIRLNPLLQSKSVRAILCTPGHSFSLRTAMDSGKVVLVNLADGILGAQEASIIGQLIVSQLQLATMSRANIPENARRPFYAYLDEFQKFCNTDTVSYGEMLARGRRYRVPLILAHQETGQIPDGVMRGIFGTVSTLVAFTISYADAQRLGREMSLQESQRLQDQARGHCHCRLERKSFPMVTDPPPTHSNAEAAAEVIRRSRERFGAALQAKPESRPAIEPSPPVVQDRTPEHPPSIEKPPPPSIPGRGGEQHKYLQTLISRWADANGWRPVVEERILGGLGSVDVALRKGERSVACEIGVTTSPDHEVENIQKCLAAGFERVVVVSPEKKTRNQIKARAASSLDPQQADKVAFCTPEELFDFLGLIESETQASEKTVRGYKVKVRFKGEKPEEKQRKQGVVSGIIAKAMKRIRKGKS